MSNDDKNMNVKDNIWLSDLREIESKLNKEKHYDD